MDRLVNKPRPEDQWRHDTFNGWLAAPVDGKDFGKIVGVTRGVFGVSPDLLDADHDAAMNVGVTYLPAGVLIAEAPHGAAGMLIADALSARMPELFGRWPWDGELAEQLAPAMIELIQECGGRPTIDTESG